MSKEYWTFAELMGREHEQLQEAERAKGQNTASSPTPQTGISREEAGGKGDDALKEVKVPPYCPDHPDYITSEGNTGEPWVKTAVADRVGLALSGGGIRSAVFNLGLLEALDQRRVLALVDYLSTVSGGSYIGGFWTAWRDRVEKMPPSSSAPGVDLPSVFPHRNSTDVRNPGDTDNRERPETRHLREFGRYLIPRIGINESEMWFALATIISGVLPALMTTLALICLFFYTWLGLGYLAFHLNVPIGNYFNDDYQLSGKGLIFAAVTLFLHAWRRTNWRRGNNAETADLKNDRWTPIYWKWAIISTVAGALISQKLCSYDFGYVSGTGDEYFRTFDIQPPIAWLCLALLTPMVSTFCEALKRFSERRRILKVIAMQRSTAQIGRLKEKIRKNRLDRGSFRDILASRYLSWALVSAAITAIWYFSFWVANKGFAGSKEGHHEVGGVGGFTAIFTGLYLWLRTWVTKAAKEIKDGGAWQKFFQHFKVFLPNIAAKVGALSLVVFAIVLMRSIGLKQDGIEASISATIRAHLGTAFWASVLDSIFNIPSFFFFCLVACLIALWLFDPAYFGLHDFYRARISRAFLGAAFRPGPASRKANKRVKDLIDAAEERKAPGDDLDGLISRLKQIQDNSPSEADNRYTVERFADDLCLTNLPASLKEFQGREEAKPTDKTEPTNEEIEKEAVRKRELRSLRLRPIHLICCAANNLTGDRLASLSRGARSAVLSQRGISAGDATCCPSDGESPLMLSAAQTASGAAFNSQMGEKTIWLGMASCFLMTAFNLRLGLWVRNPSKVLFEHDQALCKMLEPTSLGGVSASRELWKRLNALRGRIKKGFDRYRASEPWKGLNALSVRIRERFRRYREWFRQALLELLRPSGLDFFKELFGLSRAYPENASTRLHLSDGGHFENLGLYELIRRHVRYIIVSDADQDENFTFGDMGNAIRRVREDFGVEIEIDLSPIRVDADMVSRQHSVVGTIHYDGFEGCDKGTLLYIKPTFTGDEPGDIQQYRCENRRFPHDSTGNQFFSEPQWESYRRLGEHIGQMVFGYLNELDSSERSRKEVVFGQLQIACNILPAEMEARIPGILAKFVEVEKQILKEASDSLYAELWPELHAAVRRSKGGVTDITDPAGAVKTDLLKLASLLLQMIQVTEEVWLTLRLDKLWAHPKNSGTMTHLHRWWRAPTLRTWWVLFAPLCCSEFRQFARTNFDLHLPKGCASNGNHSIEIPRLELKSVGYGGLKSNPKVKADFEKRQAELQEEKERIVGELAELENRTEVERRRPAVEGKRKEEIASQRIERTERIKALEENFKNLKEQQTAAEKKKLAILKYFLVTEPNGKSIPVGTLIYVHEQFRDVISWNASDLSVSPSLSGSSIKKCFLGAVIDRFKPVPKEAHNGDKNKDSAAKVKSIEVTLEDEFPGRRDDAARQGRLNAIVFYKSWGFSIESDNSATILGKLSLDLEKGAP